MLTISRYFCFLIIFNSFLYSQNFGGTRIVGLGGASVALNDDIWVSFYNPAVISADSSFHLSVYYSPAPFGMQELQKFSAVSARTFEFGNFNLAFNTFGFELYRESKLKLSYAYELIPEFAAGINLNIHNFSIRNYGSANAFSIDFGIKAILIKNLFFGASFLNLTNAELIKGGERLPQTFYSGLAWYGFKNLLFALDLEKETEKKLNLRFGTEYKITEFLSLRSGYSTFPAGFSFGTGVEYSGLVFDYALQMHSELGFSHNIGLNFNF